MRYRPKTRMYRHQALALKKLAKIGWSGALLMEPRTGKTKTSIDWLGCLYTLGKIERVLIVCPNRVMGVWQAEFHAHAAFPFHLTIWDADSRKDRRVPPTQPGVLNILVVNYKAFSTPGKRLPSGRYSQAKGRFKNRELIWKWAAGAPMACILDESHKIKSASGKAASMLVTMAPRFAYRLILTGTPVTKASRVFDVYMQWAFLNPERFSDVPTLADFKARYGRWEQRGTYAKFLGPKNIPELRARLEADSVIVRRQDCFDLPEREDLVRYVDLLPSTRERYTELAEELITQLVPAEGSEDSASVATASIKLVLNLRLSQLTSGFLTDVDGKTHRLGFEKADVLRELLIERAELDEKLVVAARYRADLDLIESMVRELGLPVWSIRGGLSREDTDQARRDFQAHDGAGAMVLQPAAAALGIDLSSASHMVWYSHTPSWVDFSQTCDRIALSRTSTTFTHLIARHSVDEVLLSTLAKDGELAREVMKKPSMLRDGTTLQIDATNHLIGGFTKAAGI